MFKCKNCGWEGEEAKNNRFCMNCGDNAVEVSNPKSVIKKVEEKPKKESKPKKKGKR